MPATYRHVYTYEQTTGRERNAWKKPEPQPDKLTIFGYEVEPSVFRKYNHQNYSIGFGFYDLAAVERFATDPSRISKFPEHAEEAKQIMQKIIAEITGRKENIVKDSRTAADFITALQDIYNESRAVYDSINANVEKAREKMDRAHEAVKEARGADAGVSNAKYEIAQAEYKLANSEVRPAYNHMMNEHDAKVNALREQFAAFLDDHYAASPDKLDSATMQLLNSGICTPSELSRLIDRHKDNPTMLRIVGNFARNMREDKKQTLTYNDRLICTQVAGAAHAAKDGSRELAIFDSAVSSLAYGLSDDYGHASRMHNYVAAWAEDFKNQISNLPLTPAEQSEP